MQRRSIAYTGDDLIQIGRTVNKITRRLKAFEAYSGSDVEDKIYNLNVEVTLDEDVVGYVGFEDGWLGFRPYPIDDHWNQKVWINEKENNE